MSYSIQYVNDELLKKLCIKKVQISANQFPRFQFALNNTLDIVLRNKSSFLLNGNENDPEKILTFYFFDYIETSRNITDVFLQDANAAGNIIKITNVGNLENFVGEPSISCFVIPGDIKEILANVGNKSTINLILTDSDRAFRAISRNQIEHQNTFVIRTIKSKEVDITLEKWIFQRLKAVFKALTKDIKACKSKELGSYVKRTNAGLVRPSPKRKLTCTPDEMGKYKMPKLGNLNRDSNLHSRQKTQEFVHGSPSKIGDEFPKVSKILTINEELLCTLTTDAKVGLLEEITGLFKMSDAITDDMTIIDQKGINIDLKEISKRLFSKFNCLHGIGYRMQKLQIVVKDGRTLDSKEKLELRNYLEGLNLTVNDYEVIQMSIKRFLNSGDEIKINGNLGSFGCFARSCGNAEKIYGLFSKHVAVSSDLFSKADDKHRHKKIGSIITDTVMNGNLDVAAACISIPRTTKWETIFKSAEGQVLPQGKKCFQTKPFKGQKVHIWGATSKPGKGVITVPEYICADMDHTLIQVEDIVDEEGTVEERFAKPGDSGAIACSDNPKGKYVCPVSVIMECMNYYNDVMEDDKNEVKKKRGKYLTVPLQSCLEEISRTIGENIELC